MRLYFYARHPKENMTFTWNLSGYGKSGCMKSNIEHFK